MIFGAWAVQSRVMGICERPNVLYGPACISGLCLACPAKHSEWLEQMQQMSRCSDGGPRHPGAATTWRWSQPYIKSLSYLCVPGERRRRAIFRNIAIPCGQALKTAAVDATATPTIPGMRIRRSLERGVHAKHSDASHLPW